MFSGVSAKNVGEMKQFDQSARPYPRVVIFSAGFVGNGFCQGLGDRASINRCHFRYLAPGSGQTHVWRGLASYQTRQTTAIHNGQVFALGCGGFLVLGIVGRMSDTQFTRADWRPSAKRASYVRVKPWGGQKQAPAALLAHSGSVSGFGSGKHRRCDHCRRWALKGLGVCRWHGGSTLASKTRPYVRTARTIALKTQAQALVGEDG